VQKVLSALEAGLAIGPFVRMEDRLRIEPPALLGYTQRHKLTHNWTGEGMNRVSAASKKQVIPGKILSNSGCIAARAIHAFDPDGRNVIRVSRKGESCTISFIPHQ
jgi:hypothetical protein